VVEQVCKVLAEAVTGSEIPNLIVAFNRTPESPEERLLAKWKRLFNAVAAVQNRLGDGRPLINLVNQVMAPVRFSSRPRSTPSGRWSTRSSCCRVSVRVDGKVACWIPDPR
jgi:hypothetical protein